MTERFLLAIETSCDDTGVAVVGERGTVLAARVASQDEHHRPYHGVVPEIASRAHLLNMEPTYRSVMDASGLNLEDLAAIAVTSGPGLVGSLLVGLNFAKGLSLASNRPLVAVNHIRGHVRALFLEYPQVPLPALALITSGGHTHLFLVNTSGDLALLVKTRDDAVGEAFDKLAKMLGLGFPGGPAVDRLARQGDPKRFAFRQPKLSDGSKDYSFSGYKTAALRHIQAQPQAFRHEQAVSDLCASFQSALVTHLLDRVKQAFAQHAVESLLLGGGVACNSELRRRATDLAAELGIGCLVSQPKLCTDNAAMIGAEGWFQFQHGGRAALDLAPKIKAKAYCEYRPLR